MHQLYLLTRKDVIVSERRGTEGGKRGAENIDSLGCKRGKPETIHFCQKVVVGVETGDPR